MPLQDSCPPQHSLSPHSQRHAHGPQFPSKSNAQNEDLTPPLRPAEMVSIRIQDLERPASPEENQSCIGMMNQNSLTGFTANGQTPRTCDLMSGLGLPLFWEKASVITSVLLY